MQKLWTLFLAVLLLVSGSLPAQTDPAVEARIDAIMARMDVVDKVGEMTQLAIDMLSVGEFERLAEPHTLDMDKLRRALVEYRVGSILNVSGHGYTREHWHEVLTAIQDVATKEKPSGIPVLYGIDAIHGANYSLGATLFPQQIGLAATWNPDLAFQAGRITALETRSCGIPWNFSPVMDIGRDPRWPRLWETFGEDVLLAGAMGEALVRGYQGDNLADPNSVAACLKHFLGYSTPRTGKDRTPAYIPERQLREYHVPTFQRGVTAGAASIMVCSGEMNGTPVHADRWVLTDLLRGEMGFTGVVVSDWADIQYLYNRHHVAADYREAIKMAINAGIDMSMVPNDLEFPRLLRELVEAGEVPMSRIDEAVRRILRMKIALGLFENPYPPQGPDPRFGAPDHAVASLQAALESMTLLKNDDNALPLAPGTRVLLTGPTAHSLNYLNGGWTGTWQGNNPTYNTPGKATILEAMQQALGAAQVRYVPGTTVDSVISINAAVASARQVDVIVACLGEATYTEKPGDIDDLDLPPAQVELIQALAATGKPIVLVLAEGRPRIIREVEPLAQAILMAYLPGNEGAAAIVQTLLGAHNPAGRLPYTYPRYSNDLLNYDHKGSEAFTRYGDYNGYQPQFAFGHGLSYTSFVYENLRLSSNELTAGGLLTVSVDVSNTGSRAGQEVVACYVSDEVASISPSVRRLRAFTKISLEPGQTQTVQLQLRPTDLAFVGADQQWITEPGAFRVLVGGKTATFTYK